MNSQDIFDAIEEIAATSSKNDKERLVTRYSGEAEFCRVLEYAYNPFKTYGLRKRPDTIGNHVGHDFDPGTWELLDDLIARRLTGAAAIEAVQGEMTALSADSAELFWRIIKKDLRAGFSESTCNKAKKDLIPSFPYQRCSLPKDTDLTKWPWCDGVISQEKADGMFANVDHERSGLVSIRSRQGTEFPMDKFQNIVLEVQSRTTPGHQMHGEIIVRRDGKTLDREIGNGIMNSVLNGGDFGPGEVPVFQVWDQIPLTSVAKKGKYDIPYIARLNYLVCQLKHPVTCVELIPTKVVRSLAEAYAHAGELMKAGKEGTVIKHPKAAWKDGTSKEQIKIKLEFAVDLVITGIVPGREGTKNEGRAGSLSCQSSDGKLRVDVTVKNEAMRNDVDAHPDDWIGRVIIVIANDIMEPSDSNEFHSLFLPRMAAAAYRTDKTEADTLESIKAQKDAAIFGKKLKDAA